MAKRKKARFPRSMTKPHKLTFWGKEYDITPAKVNQVLGDGKKILWFEPLNTRPDYYIIRVDSSFGTEGNDDHEDIEDVIEAIADEYSEIERERECLEQDLVDQGIEPDGDNTDLAGNEDRLGWPVLSLDSGYSWGEMKLTKRKSGVR